MSMIRITILLLLHLMMIGCSIEESQLKSKILDAAANSKSKRITLDISTLVTGKVDRVCIQGPYMLKEYFEAHAQREAPDYHAIDDTEFIIWIFLTEGKTPIQINFDRSIGYSKSLMEQCNDSPILTIEDRLISSE